MRQSRNRESEREERAGERDEQEEMKSRARRHKMRTAEAERIRRLRDDGVFLHACEQSCAPSHPKPPNCVAAVAFTRLTVSLSHTVKSTAAF